MNDWATLDREVLTAILGVGFGWCASQVYGLRALRSQRRALRNAELRVEEKEEELAEAVERTLRGEGKVDTSKLAIMLTCTDCPNCASSLYIKRSPRCFGIKGECPDHEIHYHSKCTKCGVDWLECTPEETVRQIQDRKKREEKNGPKRT
jgi:hypothetical protein